MSDDPKDNPPAKLQLSRDLKNQVENEAANKTGHQSSKQLPDSPNPEDKSNDAAKTESKESDSTSSKLPPITKLKLRPLYDPSTENDDLTQSRPQTKLESSPPPTAETSQQSQLDAPRLDAHKEAKEIQAATKITAGAKSGFDPQNPFGNAIKNTEIKGPEETITHASNSSKSSVTSHSTEDLEETIKKLETPAKQTSAQNSILPSIIVICILLIALAAAAFGLWMLLAPGSSENDTAASETTSGKETAIAPPATKEAPTGPIQRAKDTIAKVPVADIDAITAENPSDRLDNSPSAVKIATSAAPVVAPVAETAATTNSITPPATDIDLADIASATQTRSAVADKESISKYLSEIHIGGLRKGDRPMVLIEGQRFLVGDIVHEATGLKFDGIRNGQLAFRDSHGIVYLKSF
jgi:hypothetical protein